MSWRHFKREIVVKKFGGACFKSINDYRLIASQIAAEPIPVVVVVSAKYGDTDSFHQDIVQLEGNFTSPAAETLMATGELQSAAKMVLALQSVGLKAKLIDSLQVFATDGRAADASVTSVNTHPIEYALSQGLIPVIPGFYGANPAGQPATFGRGGSDYSAVVLGQAIGARSIELLKAEVDGIYSCDPRKHATAVKFEQLSHFEALSIARAGGKVFQEKAAEFAHKHKIEVVVRSAFGQSPGTTVRIPS